MEAAVSPGNPIGERIRGTCRPPKGSYPTFHYETQFRLLFAHELHTVQLRYKKNDKVCCVELLQSRSLFALFSARRLPTIHNKSLHSIVHLPCPPPCCHATFLSFSDILHLPIPGFNMGPFLANPSRSVVTCSLWIGSVDICILLAFS